MPQTGSFSSGTGFGLEVLWPWLVANALGAGPDEDAVFGSVAATWSAFMASLNSVVRLGGRKFGPFSKTVSRTLDRQAARDLGSSDVKRLLEPGRIASHIANAGTMTHCSMGEMPNRKPNRWRTGIHSE